MNRQPMAIGEFYPGCEEILMFEISDFVIREYSKPKKHYSVCFIKIHKSIPFKMVEFY